jgi:hypothetical protein
MEKHAALTTLGEAEVVQPCSILGLDGKTMQLKLPRYLTLGSAVKVEANDTLSLGEVSYCRPEGDSYVVSVELLQALHNVAEMSRLAKALLG